MCNSNIRDLNAVEKSRIYFIQCICFNIVSKVKLGFIYAFIFLFIKGLQFLCYDALVAESTMP